jgi:Kef-type K+ transport system membrane component KefB
MDVGGVLLDILIVLVAAKIAAEVAERIGVPAVVAEIVAGALIGPSVFGLVGSNETLAVLGELGVILLLLGVGMEMDIGELGAVGKAALSVALVGVAFPMAGGYATITLLGHSSNEALFLGAALAATSVGITARVLSDLRALATVEARTVLGAAVADDVLGLVILTVVVRLVSQGSVSVGTVIGILGVAIVFLVLATLLGSKFAPPLFAFLDRNARSAGTLVALALAFTLAFAELADAAKLAPIVGAFVAGLALSGSTASERIQRELAPIGHIFIPVFFLQIGIEVDVGSLVSTEVLVTGGVLLVVAIIGKVVAGLAVGRSPGDKLLIGIGMIPRGEVGLIFAAIGLREGILGNKLYASLLLVVLVTTLMTPPLLRMRLEKVRGAGRRVESTASEPVSGWLRVDEGSVGLAAEPPSRLALHVSLQAAQAITGGARPGRDLLDWIGEWSDTGLRWDDDATTLLFAVLTDGDVRAWRFLETTGVLERALPELAEAVRRRRADPFLLDPNQVLSFALVERIRDLVASDARAAEQHAALAHPEWLLLAALILDTAGEESLPVDVARRLAHRLDLGAAAEQELALLVGDSGLLRAAARKVDGLDEERVFPVVIHLEREERARALYLLTLALGELSPWDRERLEELFTLVLRLLQQPEVSGLEARNLVERRRAESERYVEARLASASSVKRAVERVKHAQRSYLLAEHASDIARQVMLLDPLPARHEARVGVIEVDAQQWKIEVAARDRPGLLATVSGVLADHGLDVIEAIVATWGDGAALDSFVVRRSQLSTAPLTADELARLAPPDRDGLRSDVITAFDLPITTAPNPDSEVRFDELASPWYTICEVRSPDRRGLLHSLTAGIASAGASVHSARLVTVAGHAVDRFELSDQNGRKLDDATRAAIVAAIRDGVTPKRRGFASMTRRR